MAKEMRLDIKPPADGWVTVRLTAPGAVLEFAASYTPRDSIRDLASAAAGLLAGVPDQVVVWNTEPAEYEFRFVTAAGRTRLEVRQYADIRRQSGRPSNPVLVVEGNVVAIARALWRGLRRLQGGVPGEEFAAAWRHPFPTATVRRLGECLRE
ncbi:MAG TPA: hypothetical protein VKE40_03200 [Gemmataceae bacterium]|nr:hypothetical protein [Gemmataceae bacterium]